MHGTGDKFIALAGPRIRSPRRAVAAPRERVEHLPDRHLARTDAGHIDAAQILIQQLREDWRSMVPWHVLRHDPVRHLRTLVPAGAAVVVLAAALSAPAWLLALAVGGLGLYVVRTLGGRHRAIAQAARELQAKMDEPVGLEELRGAIAAVLRLDPDHDAARLLFAQSLLLEGAPLDALMQLAPLRDHHPDEGIVVFLGALAYARLGAHGDAARMLGALRIDPDHPWNNRIRRLEHHCRRSCDRNARVVSGELEGDL